MGLGAVFFPGAVSKAAYGSQTNSLTSPQIWELMLAKGTNQTLLLAIAMLKDDFLVISRSTIDASLAEPDDYFSLSTIWAITKQIR